MLKNIREGLCAALRDEDAAAREELKAEHAKGFAEGRDYIRQIFKVIDDRTERGRVGAEAAS